MIGTQYLKCQVWKEFLESVFESTSDTIGCETKDGQRFGLCTPGDKSEWLLWTDNLAFNIRYFFQIQKKYISIKATVAISQTS